MQDYSKYCNEEIKFTCAVLSISSISSMTLTYMWSKGVHACSIHVTGMIFFTLVNIWETVNTFCTLFLSTNVFLAVLESFQIVRKNFHFFVVNETCNLHNVFFFTSPNMIALKQTGLDRGNSMHKHVWVMLLEKTKPRTSRTIVPARTALFDARGPLI